MNSKNSLKTEDKRIVPMSSLYSNFGIENGYIAACGFDRALYHIGRTAAPDLEPGLHLVCQFSAVL